MSSRKGSLSDLTVIHGKYLNPTLFDGLNSLLPSAMKLQRLCFYRRVSVHGGGGIPACLAAGLWGCLLPEGVPAPRGACSRGMCGRDSPASRQLLMRTVRILLECILVKILTTGVNFTCEICNASFHLSWTTSTSCVCILRTIQLAALFTKPLGTVFRDRSPIHGLRDFSIPHLFEFFLK